MNPFNEKPEKLNATIMNWKDMAPAPYRKQEIDAYTRVRQILMNGTEFEQNWFMHQFARHTDNYDLRRDLALIRRLEQQQQKMISALKPIDETTLETTIGYEQLAVDLTAILAEDECDENVKKALHFALLEDFDHLYRYADLLDMEQGIKSDMLVGKYTEIMPGRPTISEHRYPYDDVKPAIDCKTADMMTKLHVNIITAAEQQTMNYYMNIGATHMTELGRKLYSEIAMIEEQHVTQYESLLDPHDSWFDSLLMHEYTECYLYYSCMQDESDPNVKAIWEKCFLQEIAHLHKVCEMLEKYEGRHYTEIIPNGEFPKLLKFAPKIEYIRKVLETVNLTARREGYEDICNIPDDYEYFTWQNAVNTNPESVASHNVIEAYIADHSTDYRFQTAPHPVAALDVRTSDNTTIGRVKQPVTILNPPHSESYCVSRGE